MSKFDIKLREAIRTSYAAFTNIVKQRLEIEWLLSES